VPHLGRRPARRDALAQLQGAALLRAGGDVGVGGEKGGGSGGLAAPGLPPPPLTLCASTAATAALLLCPRHGGVLE
jgi:hypothetical protein